MDAGLQPDLTRQLPQDLNYQVVHASATRSHRPSPTPPEDRIRRYNAIIATVASLCPANTAEVILASQFVAAKRSGARLPAPRPPHPADAPHVLKCTAQSAAKMRQSRGAMGQLLRLQAVREKSKPPHA